MDDAVARTGPRLKSAARPAHLAAAAALLAALGGCVLAPATAPPGSPSAPSQLHAMPSAGTGAGPVRALTPASAAPAAAPLPPGAALDRLLGELRPLLPTELRPGFEQAQRRWQLYAETDCRWQRGLSDGGSAGALVYGQCMKNRAAQRVGDLKLLLCEGFGLTGPCEASARYDRLAD